MQLLGHFLCECSAVLRLYNLFRTFLLMIGKSPIRNDLWRSLDPNSCSKQAQLSGQIRFIGSFSSWKNFHLLRMRIQPTSFYHVRMLDFPRLCEKYFLITCQNIHCSSLFQHIPVNLQQCSSWKSCSVFSVTFLLLSTFSYLQAG